MTFRQNLEKITKKNNSLLCIGLDPDLEKNPSPIFPFNKSIIDATNDQVCAYKPNIAFYEARGIDGLKSLKKTIDYLKSNKRIHKHKKISYPVGLKILLLKYFPII